MLVIADNEARRINSIDRARQIFNAEVKGRPRLDELGIIAPLAFGTDNRSRIIRDDAD
jgi:hypothetical protein